MDKAVVFLVITEFIIFVGFGFAPELPCYVAHRILGAYGYSLQFSHGRLPGKAILIQPPGKYQVIIMVVRELLPCCLYLPYGEVQILLYADCVSIRTCRHCRFRKGDPTISTGTVMTTQCCTNLPHLPLFWARVVHPYLRHCVSTPPFRA